MATRSLAPVQVRVTARRLLVLRSGTASGGTAVLASSQQLPAAPTQALASRTPDWKWRSTLPATVPVSFLPTRQLATNSKQPSASSQAPVNNSSSSGATETQQPEQSRTAASTPSSKSTGSAPTAGSNNSSSTASLDQDLFGAAPGQQHSTDRLAKLVSHRNFKLPAAQPLSRSLPAACCSVAHSLCAAVCRWCGLQEAQLHQLTLANVKLARAFDTVSAGGAVLSVYLLLASAGMLLLLTDFSAHVSICVRVSKKRS